MNTVANPRFGIMQIKAPLSFAGRSNCPPPRAFLPLSPSPHPSHTRLMAVVRLDRARSRLDGSYVSPDHSDFRAGA